MLFDKLDEYGKRDVTPFHMPGHKRKTARLDDTLPYRIDITEIDGFDDLYHPYGDLKETAERAAALYGNESAFLLVNGSTGGILAAVSAAVRYGDTVIMARNCHKSVYNAVEMNGLQPVYIMPAYDEYSGICGSIQPRQIEEAINAHPEAKLIILTSPSYEGVVSDVQAICRAAHTHHIPVLVDAAHGAHLGISDYFPKNTVESGADIVIMSLHKTLPALTQCALAYVSGGLIDTDKLAAALAVFQTSSPSYVLLSSIDRCVGLLTRDKETLFHDYVENLKVFDERIMGLKRLRVLCHSSDSLSAHPAFFAFDPGKIVISTRGTNTDGPALMQCLRSKFSIELEMAYADYAIAMTSICDTADDFQKLAAALLEIDSRTEIADDESAGKYFRTLPARMQTAAQARGLSGTHIPLEQSEGMIALEYVWAYPPGIPFVVPGEVIDVGMPAFISCLSALGTTVRSTTGQLPSQILCTMPAKTYL